MVRHSTGPFVNVFICYAKDLRVDLGVMGNQVTVSDLYFRKITLAAIIHGELNGKNIESKGWAKEVLVII